VTDKAMEVVAPVGKRAVLAAAACNGADAVYFGLGDLNARKRAENFQPEELGEIVKWLHSRNVEAYLTLNTLVFHSEIDQARKYLVAMARAGADAVIVQDLGIARLAKAIAPGLRVHASTQMSLTEAQGIELVRKELGIERAVLARELSIEEIKRVRAGTQAELEVFVHGAMCISYSGQCLASLMMLDRSANRGVCGQPCRMVYDVLVGGKVVKAKGKYVLSPRDLAAYEHVKELAEAGVTALKIEGRMKSEYYVAAATKVYRQAADSAARGHGAEVGEEEKLMLLQTFSRGFSTGFLKGKDHKELVHAQFGKNRGVLVGELAGVEKGEARIRLAAEYSGKGLLKAGDGVVIEDGESEQGGRLYGVREAAGEARLVFGHGEVDLSGLGKGARVWKTDDPQVRKKLEATWARDEVYRKTRLDVKVWAEAGKQLKIEVSDEGYSVTVQSEKPLEPARSRAAGAEVFRQQLGRLGGTPFELGELKVEAMGNAMVPASVLNALRRKAVEMLIEKRETSNAVIRENIEIPITQRPEKEGQGGVSVVVRSMEQAQAAAKWEGVRRIYGEFGSEEENKQFVQWAKGVGLSAGLVTPQVIKPGQEWVLEEILRCGAEAVLVRNLAAVAFFKDKGIEMVADASLNAANELAADVLLGWGVKKVTFARDVGAAELRDMVAVSNASWYEAVVYGHTAMFHMEHCIAAANAAGEGGCGKACKAGVELRDLKGTRYRVGADRMCRNTVYAAGGWREREYLEAVREAGVRSIRIELGDESAEDAQKLGQNVRTAPEW
jgi:U32 family peptidase